jgi:hypothetical protein
MKESRGNLSLAICKDSRPRPRILAQKSQESERGVRGCWGCLRPLGFTWLRSCIGRVSPKKRRRSVALRRLGLRARATRAFLPSPGVLQQLEMLETRSLDLGSVLDGKRRLRQVRGLDPEAEAFAGLVLGRLDEAVPVDVTVAAPCHPVGGPVLRTRRRRSTIPEAVLSDAVLVAEEERRLGRAEGY